MVSIMWPIEITYHLKGEFFFWSSEKFRRKIVNIIKLYCLHNFRIGWMTLILLFIYFSISICSDQILRFLNGPIVVSLEKDYRNWGYEPMTITICTDYLNEDAMNNVIQRYINTTGNSQLDHFDLYQRYFHMIASLNANNFQSLNEFANVELFANLTGDDLLTIVTEVGLQFLSQQNY